MTVRETEPGETERERLVAPLEPALEDLLAEFDRALSEGRPSEAIENEISERFGSLGSKLAGTITALHASSAQRVARGGKLAACPTELEETWTLSTPVTAVSTPAGGGGRQFGRFQLVGRIGSGGSGVVFKALDAQLGWHVALKVARAETLFSEEARQRFRREAQVLAALRHPNIIVIHEAGEADGLPYIVQELCRGPNLAVWLRDQQKVNRPVPISVAARWVMLASQAVAHAQQRGIVHRDLKPANILLEPLSAVGASGGDSRDDAFVPRITDFGIAKLFDSEEGVTGTVAVLGTAAYMAPEQAEGKTREVGKPADVYSLGVILYELLTGRRPIEGQTDLDTLRRLASDVPHAISKFRKGVPRDLQAVCLKCLEKVPADRYPTAHELASDLERFLGGVPVKARPAGIVRRAFKAYRRQRRVIHASLLVSACVLASIWFLIQRVPRGPATEVDAEAQYIADVRSAYNIWNENDERIHDNPTAAKEMAALLSRQIPASGEVDRRGFDWHYLCRLCHPAEAVGTLAQIAAWQAHAGDAYFVTFSRDGSRLASSGGDKTARVWDAASGRPVCVCSGHTDDVNWVDFSPDGTLLATASDDHTVRIWDAKTGKEKFSLLGHNAKVVATLFSPDGKSVFSGDHNGVLKQWDLTSKREIRSIPAHDGRINSLFLAADGRLLVSGGGDDRVRLWSLPELHPQGGQQTIATQSATVSSDGEMIAAAGNEIINVYDVRSGGLRSSYNSLSQRMESVRFSPDGRQLASCGADGKLRLFDRCTGQTWVATPARKVTKLPSTEPVTVGLWCVAYSPKGERIALAARDGGISIWDASTTPCWTTIRNTKYDGVPAAVTFAPDGNRLAIGSINTDAHEPGFEIWNVSSSHLKVLHEIADKEARNFCFSPDGTDLVVARKGTIDVYDGQTVERRLRIDLPPGTEALSLGFDAGGSLIGLIHPPGSPKTTIHVYDAKSGSHVGTIGKPFLFQQPGPMRFAFLADGTRLGTLSQRDRTSSIDIYSLPGGQRHSIDFEPGNWIGDFALSPTEPLMAVRHLGEIQFWDIATGRALGSLPGSQAESGPIEFAADGRLLFAAGVEQHHVQIWNVRQRTRLYTLPLPREAALHARHWFLEVSPDGRKLACRVHDATGRVGGVYLYSGLPDEAGSLESRE